MLSKEAKAKRVIIVDDNMAMRKMLETMLISIDIHNYYTYNDGKSAWDKIQEGEVDLIISDYVMPGMNGLELLRLVRKSKKFYTIPFIMVTGADHRGEVANTLQAEVDCYLIKPITASALEVAITQIVKEQQSTSPYLKAMHNGKHHYMHGEYDEALKHFSLAQSLNQDNAQPYYYLGLITYETGRTNEAEKYLNRCIELNDNYLNALMMLAQIYTKRRDYMKMYDLLDKALELAPDNVNIYLNLAFAAYHLDRMAVVRKILDRATRVAKGQLDDVRRIIDVYIKVGLFDEADYLYGKRLESDDNDVNVSFWNRLGLAAKKRGMIDKAKQFYMSALKVDPQHRVVNYNLGQLFFEAGDYESSQAYVSKILRLYPDFKEAEGLQTVLNVRLGKS